jgi:Transcription activator MBF2
LYQSKKFSTTTNRDGVGSVIETNMNFPQIGCSKQLITYIELRMDQTSDKFDARITRGGINSTYVTLQIRSVETLYQNVTVVVYGSKK